MHPEQSDRADLLAISAALVAAYVSNNSLPTAELPKLIDDIHGALRSLGAAVPVEPEKKPEPAVSVRKSVTADFIICLEDGKKFKSLKRHLQSQYGLTPAEYRQKWSLPADYPMVAPSYSESRSALAKASGLGQLRKAPALAPQPRPVIAEKPSRAPRVKKTPASTVMTARETVPPKRAQRRAKGTEEPVAEATLRPKRTRKAAIPADA